MNVEIKRAKTEAEAFLTASDPEAQTGDRWTVELWEPDYGIRVSEVSITRGNAGASNMQVEPDGLRACAALERLIIAYHIRNQYDANEWENWGRHHVEDAEAMVRSVLFPI